MPDKIRMRRQIRHQSQVLCHIVSDHLYLSDRMEGRQWWHMPPSEYIGQRYQGIYTNIIRDMCGNRWGNPGLLRTVIIIKWRIHCHLSERSRSGGIKMIFKTCAIILYGILCGGAVMAACVSNGTVYTSCKPGYYLNKSNCTACPGTGTSADKNMGGVTECYLPAGSAGADASGAYTYTANCPYSN